MKRFSTTFAILAMAAFSLSLVSCEKDAKTVGRKAIGFNVKCATTKSAPITTASLQETYGEFFSAAFLPGETDPYYESGIATCVYQKSEEDDEMAWLTGEFWPENADQAVDFWSFAPTSEFATSPTFTTADGNRTMTFNYKPLRDGSHRLDAVDQQDLLVAYTGNRKYQFNSDNKVPVTFNHALSAIRFKVGNVDPIYAEKDLVVSSLNLAGFADGGTCTVTETGDADSQTNNGTIAGSNMTISWVPNTTTCTYQNFFSAEGIESGDYLDGGTSSAYGDGIFMVVPQEIPDGAELVLNWGFMEVPEGSTTGTPEYIQRTSRSGALKNIELEPGYVYTFTLDINKKTDEKEIYVELSEKIPWDYIQETKDYDEIQTGYPELSFSNYNSNDASTRSIYVYQKSANKPLQCSVRLNSPKGAKLLVKIEQEFDAFEYEFVTSDQIPEADNTPITFTLTPAYDDSERDYVATLSLSLRLVNGRIVNIDNEVQRDGKYKIILQKAF